VDESRWTTAYCRHGRSLSHVGNDRLDDNAGAEEVSGLSHRGALKAVETTCLWRTTEGGSHYRPYTFSGADMTLTQRVGRRFRNKYHYSFLKLSFTDVVCWVLLGAFAKLRKGTICFIMFLSPHRITQLPLDGFSWNLIFEYFFKICQKIKFH